MSAFFISMTNPIKNIHDARQQGTDINRYAMFLRQNISRPFSGMHLQYEPWYTKLEKGNEYLDDSNGSRMERLYSSC